MPLRCFVSFYLAIARQCLAVSRLAIALRYFCVSLPLHTVPINTIQCHCPTAHQNALQCPRSVMLCGSMPLRILTQHYCTFLRLALLLLSVTMRIIAVAMPDNSSQSHATALQDPKLPYFCLANHCHHCCRFTPHNPPCCCNACPELVAPYRFEAKPVRMLPFHCSTIQPFNFAFVSPYTSKLCIASLLRLINPRPYLRIGIIGVVNRDLPGRLRRDV